VIKFVVTCDRSLVFSDFLHNTTEILLKVALKTITLTLEVMGPKIEYTSPERDSNSQLQW
jgi:hypothetical protein